MADPFGYCEGTYSVRYLEDLSYSSCIQNVILDSASSSSSCQDGTALSLSYYTDSLKILAAPNINTVTTITIEQQNTVTIGQATEGVPTYVAGTATPACTCQNVVKRVEYFLVYAEDNTISSARLDIILGNVVSDDCTVATAVEQTFAVHFVTDIDVSFNIKAT